jgi:hypothetical protein
MEYFDPFIDDCKDDEFLFAFYHYLLEEVEVDDVINFQNTRPIQPYYNYL